MALCSSFVIALQLSGVNLSRNLLLAYQSFGVIYGDLSTSPLYVYKNTFKGKLQDHRDEESIFGAFSLIFWTLTLIPLLKYVFIVLSADDNGEGILVKSIFLLINFMEERFSTAQSDHDFVRWDIFSIFTAL